MPTWRIEYERRAEKQLEAIRDERLLVQIRAAIEPLVRNPRPTGVKKLAGYRDLWRIRVGDWRIVYRIEAGRLVVVIVTVAKRGEVYGRVGR